MTAPKKDFVPIVNLLRCIASLGVCMVHMHYFAHLDQYKFTSKLLTYGQQGVPVFFVISGFVIPYSLWNAGYVLKEFYRYMIKRSIRIDPPYIVTILLSILISCLFSNYQIDGIQLLLNLFYLIPFSHYQWYQGVFWTLGVEFQYYIIIGLLFPWLKSGNIYFIGLVLVAASCIGYFLPIVSSYAFILQHVHYFAMGIICFLYKKGRINLYAVHSLLIFLLFYLCIRISLVTGSVGYLTCIMILHVNFKTKVTDFFSKISFSLYLVHSLAGLMILRLLAKEQINPYFLFLILLAGCILVASIFYYLIERVAVNWSKKIKIHNE